MTDHTLHDTTFRPGHRSDRRAVDMERGRFEQDEPGLIRMLMDDFRAVPAEAWIILAVATVMSNLFIALA